MNSNFLTLSLIRLKLEPFAVLFSIDIVLSVKIFDLIVLTETIMSIEKLISWKVWGKVVVFLRH